MPAIHVRDVPASVVSGLKERAARHGRSMQQEVRLILQAAATAPLAGEPAAPISLVTVRATGEATWSREEMYGDEGR